MTPTLTLNNGVTMPALGFGVFQTPARRDPGRRPRRARRRATGTSTPPPPTATSARSARRSRSSGVDRVRRLPGDQDLDQRLRLRRDAARLREERRQARRRPDRPADPAPGAAVGVRQDPRGLPGAGDAARRRQGPRDRGQQLHGRAPHHAARPRRPSCPRSTRSRCTPTSPSPRCRRSAPSTASSPRPGRRSAASPSTATASTPAPSQDPVIGDIAGAHGKTPAQVMLRWGLQHGPLGHPEVHQAQPHRREHRRLRLRALRRRAWPRSTRLDTGRRGGPEPDDITLEAFGRADPRGLTGPVWSLRPSSVTASARRSTSRRRYG